MMARPQLAAHIMESTVSRRCPWDPWSRARLALLTAMMVTTMTAGLAGGQQCSSSEPRASGVGHSRPGVSVEALLEAVAAGVAAADPDSIMISSWSEGAQDIASSGSTSGSTTATPAHRDPASGSDVPPDAERGGTRRDVGGRRSLAALQALAMMNRGDWAGAEAVASAAVAKDVGDAEAWSVLGHAQARHLGWVQVA